MLKNNKVYLRKDQPKLNIIFYKRLNFLDSFERLSQKVHENISNLISDSHINLENPKIIAKPVLTKIVEILASCQDSRA